MFFYRPFQTLSISIQVESIFLNSNYRYRQIKNRESSTTNTEWKSNCCGESWS